MPVCRNSPILTSEDGKEQLEKWEGGLVIGLHPFRPDGPTWIRGFHLFRHGGQQVGPNRGEQAVLGGQLITSFLGV